MLNCAKLRENSWDLIEDFGEKARINPVFCALNDKQLIIMGGETDFGGCSDINLVNTQNFKTTQLVNTLQFNFVNHSLHNAMLKTDKVISILITD